MEWGGSIMKYAMIKNGAIDNIIVADYTMAQTIAISQNYDAAINVDNYPVKMGDLYENGSFMNAEDIKDEEGNILIPARTVIERNMTQEEYIKFLETKSTNLEVQLVATNADLQGFMDYYFSLV
jgi:hypothetical protein